MGSVANDPFPSISNGKSARHTEPLQMILPKNESREARFPLLIRPDLPEQDFGGVRELYCDKQGISQPEFSLTIKLRHSRQNGT